MKILLIKEFMGAKFSFNKRIAVSSFLSKRDQSLAFLNVHFSER